METLEQISQKAYAGALTVALPIAIVGLVTSLVTFLIAYQRKVARDKIREMRVNLERNATPERVSEMLKVYPDAAQYAPTLRVTEMIKRAHADEGSRVKNIEVLMGVCRTFLGIGVVLGALAIAGKIWPPH